MRQRRNEECGTRPAALIATTFSHAGGFTAAMKIQPLLAVLVAFVFNQASAADANWPRFRGAEGDGIAKEAEVPLTWSDTENLAWKVALPGPGSSSPIIWGDRVFLTCWSGYGDQPEARDMSKLRRHLVCLSLADGKILWDKTVPATLPEDEYGGMLAEHGYATSTPVTDGESVFVFFGKSGALAFDMDGRQLWQTDLGKSSGPRRWGSGASPVLYKDKLIVVAADESQAMYALDKKSGSQIWKADGASLDMAYSTPVFVSRDDVPSPDLVFPVAFELWGLNPDTGKLRWYATHDLPGNVSPGVIVGPEALYLFGGFPVAGSAAFKRSGGKGDLTASHKLWAVTDSSYVPTPVLHEGRLYVINDQGFAMCMDAKTGESIYRERVMDSGGGGGGGGRGGRGKPFYASPILVNGRLYCPSRRNGVFVIAAEPEYKKLAVNVFAGDSSQFNATPAVSGKRMILRSEQAAYCVTVK